jgi:hypothetical protein
MDEQTFKGRILLRNIHMLMILILLAVLFVGLSFYVNLGFLLVAAILVLTFIYLLNDTLPRHIIVNDTCIKVINSKSKTINIFKWEEIVSIEEIEYHYWDSIVKIIKNLSLYSIFSMNFCGTYHHLILSDNLDNKIYIRDYKIKDYKGLINAIKQKRGGN